MTMREELRADRIAAAEQRRADLAVASEQQRRDRALLFEQRRADAVAKVAEKERARAARAAARARFWATAWSAVRSHALDLLFVPVILVPAVLAWSAMADYGVEVFGPVGATLPLFSEAAMWAFAAAVTVGVRRGQPTGWLKFGVWAFAAVAAGLNYMHGQSLPGGWAYGVVMAVVSVGGVVVHQLITARPVVRRTRADRAIARTTRRAERRLEAVRRAAVRRAVAELSEDGTAQLVHSPGLVVLSRDRLGRVRLDGALAPEPVASNAEVSTEDWTQGVRTGTVQPPAVQDEGVQPEPLDAPVQLPASEPEWPLSEPVQPEALQAPSHQVPAAERRSANLPSPARDRARAAARRHAAHHGELPTVSHLQDLAKVSRGTAGTALQELREQPSQLHVITDINNAKAQP
jgi:hypothetical protein